ncbi:AAA family ATPase [Rhodoblastus acidophilus]|uniref:AAA family ATPase n=1 Tax=Candidatus Rhodoblastus alkanivorans TaxID=2954117 RepID=A0ABS9Z339_9HYPH|nr:YhaN family protein [Candidatus Rhodoblastus alkanivorans]MCI4677354.1 AAA family ATPase [Candidatus Rhodoblastus alkanivorans]MCI4682089.1 AAA family ATPase [Candidatus Rhodoblastus alkanivorans]MDI4639391.1 AAA family ATPase [Rhodoblastus acidophilus]
MRLIELTLDCYGPFNGVRLEFDPGARVHIVYGANETGKSSALAAIGDLFYGAPRREKISFLRPRDMRLGATIRGRNGQIMQFFRRRGDKNTLLDASGAALPDDALAPFLGAATREIFHRAFGLDAASLRAGGDDMLRAEGEIGASLFAAASGLRGLLDLRAGLDAEAEKIFGDRRAGHRAFYQALDRYDEARAQEKSAQVSEGQLKGLADAIDTAAAEIADIEAAEKEAQAERLRLERLRKAAPLLRRLALLRAEAALFTDLAAISPEAAAKFAEFLAARGRARETAERARKTREAARAEVEAAQPDNDLLAQGQTIEDLIRASGAYEKSAADLPRRETALRDARQQLDLRAQACGLATIEGLRAAAPDAATLLRAEKLIGRGREFAATKQQPERDLADEESRLAALGAQNGEALPEAEALREKLRAFGDIERRDASLQDVSRACADEARTLAEAQGRLSPPLPDLDLFACRPSPDAGAIEQAARAFDDFRAREAEARRKAEEAGERLAAAETQLRKLELEGPLVRLADLRAARARRDEAWSSLRGLFADGSSADPARLDDRARLFEALAVEADRSADILLSGAARVAAAEAEREKIAFQQTEKDRADAALAQLAEEGVWSREDWARAWEACGVTPAAPRDMLAWRAKADNLLAARDDLAREKARAEGLRQALEEARPGLEALAGACGLPSLPLGPGALARRIAARIEEIAKAQAVSREARARLADAPERIARLKAQLRKLGDDEALWRDQWLDALARLRLDSDATFDEAQARIALWRGLPAELADEEEKARRVDAIRDDILAFEQSLDALLALCGRDIPARPAETAVARLRERILRARETSALRARAERDLQAGAESARQAEEACALVEREVRNFCEDFGQNGEPEQLAARLSAREAVEQEIRTQRASLALVADGFEEAALAREIEGFDADAAQIRIDEIGRQGEERKTRAREIYAGQSAKKAEWARLQDSMGAEAAILARESARAEIHEQARRWAALKLAALLVDAGLARHRAERKDPLLARAGALFSALTEGRYAGLDQNFGEDDQLRLRARRADGAELELNGLSEGARDQLYLALRLAFLEDYAARSEAPPFIGDDLFASFDDSRVAAGFRALAAASAAIQPILFTHHAHILRLAETALGGSAQILRLDAQEA